MCTPDHLDDRLELFFGAASEAVCRVYARLERPANEGGWQLSGTLAGPECLYSQTLQTEFSFVDRGPGPTLLAEAVVPDPCFWTPQMPHLYRAELQLHEAGHVMARAERTFGIRTLGIDGRQLLYAGQPFVLRAVTADELPAMDSADCHDAQLAMLVRSPDEALCEAASRTGVLIVAELDVPDAAELRRLSRWPAVGLIALPGDATTEQAGLGRHVLAVQKFAEGEARSQASWAHAAICELPAGAEPPADLADPAVPLIVQRRAGELASVAEGRAACDQLQRDLARRGQFAGYIV